MRLGILYGGNAAEREVSLTTGQAVYDAIQFEYEAELVLLDGDILSIIDELKSYDLVFIALHGGEGENGKIQHILDDHQILYTGSGAKASQLAMDKSATKKIANLKGIPTSDWVEVTIETAESQTEIDLPFPFPVVVKPNDEGSTFGLTIVNSATDLQPALRLASEFSSKILIEAFIPGRELTVGILNNTPLPVVEIIPSHGLFDYECKYTKGLSEYVCPAELDNQLTSEIQANALDIYRAMGCRHYARIDFRLDPDNHFYLLEINTLPGFTGTSLLPKSAAKVGLSYRQLVNQIITLAKEDHDPLL
ncbi:MAG: D-alanine--D-alanine ligase [Candidatus Marinimicrobia bacterium]|nr:D-alanine--D-alanine ligase [Candidatus Neomarinimicrobiota bacterium]